MKVLKILANPVVYLLSFLFILISGQHIGGFYLLYILLALPHAGIHALLAVIGIILLLAGMVKKTGIQRNKSFINIGSVLCFLGSLFIFFINDKSGYNDETFEQTVPVIMLSIFGLLTIIFLAYNILRTVKKDQHSENLSVR